MAAGGWRLAAREMIADSRLAISKPLIRFSFPPAYGGSGDCERSCLKINDAVSIGNENEDD